MTNSDDSSRSKTSPEEKARSTHPLSVGKEWKNVNLETFISPTVRYPYVQIEHSSPYVQEVFFQQDPHLKNWINVIPVNDKQRVAEMIATYNTNKTAMPWYRADIQFRMIFKYKIADSDSLPVIQRKLTQQLAAAQRLEDWETAGKVKIVNRDPKMFDILPLPEVFEEVFATQGISWTSYSEVGYQLASKCGGKKP